MNQTTLTCSNDNYVYDEGDMNDDMEDSNNNNYDDDDGYDHDL